jgi:hypothetical protein
MSASAYAPVRGSVVQPEVVGFDSVTCPSSTVAVIEEAPFVQEAGAGAFVAFELPAEMQMASNSAVAVKAPNLVPSFLLFLGSIDSMVGRPH